MHIFLDESGTFTTARQRGAWCVVAAYVVPEQSLAAAEEAVLWFRHDAGHPLGGELKRNDAPEWAYFRFLQRLSRLDGIAAAVATDTSLNGNVIDHREAQARKILINEPRMVHGAGKAGIRQMASDVRALSAQNYVELLCRTLLAWDVVKIATLYYAQRRPEALGRFAWRFDQKNLTRNRFETTFETLAVCLMQTLSVAEPMIQLVEGDYRAFDRFSWTNEAPGWLPPLKPGASHLDAGMLWREDLDFVDSQRVIGVQIADLIVSGVFACLRGRFEDNDRAADLLGRLMVRGVEPPLRLISLGGHGDELRIDRPTGRRIDILRGSSRYILTPASAPRAAHA